MLGIHDLPLFIASGLLLNITPGADSLYIISRSAAHGLKAGIAAALGIGAGCFVHIFAAALGLSALLAASSTAFSVVKYAGAAYLVYVGISLLRSKAPLQAGHSLPAATLRSVFAQGFLTNALNPKVALFFLAFVPQFIHPASPDKALAFLLLGAIFNFNGTLWCLFLAWSAARVRAMRVAQGAATWFSRTVGAFFVVLGARLALGRAS